MKYDELIGMQIPRFQYDTPTQPGCDFYELCADNRPLVLVFLPNFGHPISREYLKQYLQTAAQLHSGRLACVVKSEPQRIAQLLNGARFPFEVICDADGVLYDLFGVKTTRSRLDWTPTAARIFREAKQGGYKPAKGEAQLLPLTMVVGPQGKVLYAHHGGSITDLPEDCAAVEQVCLHLHDAALQQPEPDDEEWEDTVLIPVTAKTAAEEISPAAQAADETVQPG